MDLIRNTNHAGNGKYAVINMRKLEGNPQTAEELAAAILKNPEAVEFGRAGTVEEFFVIKLKDKHSTAALEAYADEAFHDDNLEYSRQVRLLADRSGKNHLHCKKPD